MLRTRGRYGFDRASCAQPDEYQTVALTVPATLVPCVDGRQLVRTPSRSHALFAARWRLPGLGFGEAVQGAGDGQHRHHRSRLHVWRDRVFQRVQEGRDQADPRDGSLHGAGRPARAVGQRGRSRRITCCCWRRISRDIKNLLKLSSLAYREGFYYKPRIDKETLKEYRSGLIATSACLGGEIPAAFLKREQGRREEGRRDLSGDLRAGPVLHRSAEARAPSRTW